MRFGYYGTRTPSRIASNFAAALIMSWIWRGSHYEALGRRRQGPDPVGDEIRRALGISMRRPVGLMSSKDAAWLVVKAVAGWSAFLAFLYLAMKGGT